MKQPSIDSQTDRLREDIAAMVELMREVSMQTDPQEMVRKYRVRTSTAYRRDASISLSRRELEHPYYRITRYSEWTEDINPWKQKDRLPVLKGGLLAELIYGDEPRVISDLKVSPDDPAAEYLKGMRTMVVLPHYDGGISLNMVLLLQREPDGFDLKQLPDLILTSNLFGRATHNLVLAEQVREAYDALDAEFKIIAQIQRSLLPPSLPAITGLEVGRFYATAARAGGDYYDFFPLSNGRLGVLIADVSGHGAAAAVVMARMHAYLHAFPGSHAAPAEVLNFANEHLLVQCRAPTRPHSFVTAFYGVYDPACRSFTYSSAGHNPPRWRRADGQIRLLDGAGQYPLGVECGLEFEQAEIRVGANEDILLYTDGITEAMSPQREQFGEERLDEVFARPHESADDLIKNIVQAVDCFVECSPYVDDRTLLALRFH